MTRQCLFIDADDTLWENNVYFERVIERFIALVDHPQYSPEQVRSVLDEVERAQLTTRGYGSTAFGLNLRDAFLQLAGDRASAEALGLVATLAEGIRRQPLEVIEGVAETLAYLMDRHRLVLFTKGDPSEQADKLARSGLAACFTDARIVREKDAPTYRSTAAELGAPQGHTWMIGNSPRSDINPALEAGFKAVWVPHDATWRLEHEEVSPETAGLLVVARFSDLRRHF